MKDYNELAVGQVWQTNCFVRTLVFVGKTRLVYEVQGGSYSEESTTRQEFLSWRGQKLLNHQSGAPIDTEVYEYFKGVTNQTREGKMYWDLGAKDWRNPAYPHLPMHTRDLYRRKLVQPVLVDNKQVPEGCADELDLEVYEYRWGQRGGFGTDYKWGFFEYGEWTELTYDGHDSRDKPNLYRRSKQTPKKYHHVDQAVSGTVKLSDGSSYKWTGKITAVDTGAS